MKKTIFLLAVVLLTQIAYGTPAQLDQSSSSTALYRDPIDEKIKAELAAKWKSEPSSTSIIMVSYDLERIRNYNIDRRVAQMLVDLGPTKKHRLAIRIAKGYEDEKHALSRETYYGPHEMPNISAHYSAQAFDIFVADGVEIADQVSANPIKRKRAQGKIRQLIREMMILGRKTPNQLPTQIMIYRQEDVDYFLKDNQQLYGQTQQERVNSGIFSNPRLWDRIHIGY